MFVGRVKAIFRDILQSLENVYAHHVLLKMIWLSLICICRFNFNGWEQKGISKMCTYFV